jgi:hypothetical protein
VVDVKVLEKTAVPSISKSAKRKANKKKSKTSVGVVKEQPNVPDSQKASLPNVESGPKEISSNTDKPVVKTAGGESPQ